MTRVTTHVLDTSNGCPASGLTVRLERLEPNGYSAVASAETDQDGRIGGWGSGRVPAGRHRLVFETGSWFRAQGRETMYPEVVVHFEVQSGIPHYHLPLLLAPFGYTTYRGS